MATITSIASGYWDVAGTWDLGVPTINDDVIIAATHTVTIRDENAVCLSLTTNATGILIFECSGGATKITFKDDANAKIVNNGTITIQNTTATKKCTWAGGSSTNKVHWQTQGSVNLANYWHWEYLKITGFDFGVPTKLFVDKDIQTRDFTNYRFGELIVEPHGEPLTWIVDKGADNSGGIIVQRLAQFLGTAAYGITVRGVSGAQRMWGFAPQPGGIIAYYLTVQNSGQGFWFSGSRASRFYNCSFSTGYNTISGQSDQPHYFEDCVFSSGYRVFREASLWLKLKKCNLGGGAGENYGTSRFDLIGDENTNPPNWTNAFYDESYVIYCKLLTLTVKDDQDNPIQNAYCTLIQDHDEDYATLETFDNPCLGDSGYTDANGQVVLRAIWKKEVFENWAAKETIYYSDAGHNGPSGSPEKHLLKIVKANYWPSMDKSYYMSQDRSDTVTLTPLYGAGAGERIIKFGTFQFPHVQGVTEVKKRAFVEKFIPDRQIAYRKDIGGYGRSWRISGYIDVEIWNTKAEMQGLADGTARSFDRGTGEALVDCIMLDPEFPEDVDKYGRLGYTVALMEQSNP